MAKIIFKSLSEQGVLQKLLVSILLMAIIPLVLIIYILHTEAGVLLEKGNVRLILFFMICSIVIGYILSRKIVISVIKLTKDVQSATQGDLKERIETSEKDEIDILTEYFNQITHELERNIEDLKESKRVIQNVLLRIGSAMASSEKIENILELTIETLINALSARSGVIMLLEKGKLRMMVSYGEGLEKRKSIKIKEGEGIIGWVVKEKKAQNVVRTEQNSRFDVEVDMGIAHNSIICVPLIYKEKLIGAMSVHDKKTQEAFTNDDLILLENLAHQTAIAIENSRLNQDIERTYIETISALALAVEAKDPYNRGHSKRITEYATNLAEEFGLDKEAKNTLKDAARLHDIGKIGIKDEILLKPSILNAEQRRYMQRHAIIGENILKPIHSLAKVAYLVRHHQEWVNGKGYPDGLTGEKMSLPLKILIVADAYDAMTSDRPYRKAMSKEEAKKELKKYSGIYFDPQVVETFIRTISKK